MSTALIVLTMVGGGFLAVGGVLLAWLGLLVAAKLILSFAGETKLLLEFAYARAKGRNAADWAFRLRNVEDDEWVKAVEKKLREKKIKLKGGDA